MTKHQALLNYCETLACPDTCTDLRQWIRGLADFGSEPLLRVLASAAKEFADVAVREGVAAGDLLEQIQRIEVGIAQRKSTPPEPVVCEIVAEAVGGLLSATPMSEAALCKRIRQELLEWLGEGGSDSQASS